MKASDDDRISAIRALVEATRQFRLDLRSIQLLPEQDRLSTLIEAGRRLDTAISTVESIEGDP